MWCWSEGTISGWGIFVMELMVVFWLAIITLTVWGIKRFTQGTTTVTNVGGALDIAKQRYAKGEISKQEYEQIKKDLS